MNEREKLIQKLIKEKGGSREDYLNLLDSIAYHESAHTLDPTIKQQGGGPGRGKYQFEVGNNAGAITAARRTKQYYQEKGMKIPEWLESATSNTSLDATNLTSEQQDILFLGNMRKHPKANFKNVWDGKESISDFWANYHWAGADKDRNKRLDSFNSSLNDFKKKEEKVPLMKENNIIDENYIPTYITEDIPKQDYNISQSDIKTNEMFKNINVAAKGGMLSNPILSSYLNNKNLNEFKGGGTHEQNPLGGIPQGVGNNGKQNTVEEDETSFELKGGKYIFSNRIII